MKRSKNHYKDMPDLRQRAIQLSLDGKRPSDICRELSVARSTVWRWLRLHAANRSDTLCKPMGRPRRLSDDDRIRLTEELLAGPESNGFDTPLWTLDRISMVIHRISEGVGKLRE
jgi:transposase